MPALAATVTLTPENLLAAALNALLRLVTDPEVAHETARRAADSLIRYALPKPERPNPTARPDAQLIPPVGEGRGEGHQRHAAVAPSKEPQHAPPSASPLEAERRTAPSPNPTPAPAGSAHGKAAPQPPPRKN